MIFPPPLPIQLTDEEIRELLQLPNPCAHPSITDSHNKGYSNYGYSGYKTYVRHEWKPILLLTSTVYNCSKCGAKQEETTGAYCEQDDTF